MAVLTWPTIGNFPQVPQKGFTESIGVSVVRSSMDVGPAKQRRRANKPSEMTLSFIMTTAQTQTLETFVKDTIRGVSRFTFLHPRLNVPVDVRIMPQSGGEFYSLQYLAPGFWSTSIKFEILP